MTQLASAVRRSVAARAALARRALSSTAAPAPAPAPARRSSLISALATSGADAIGGAYGGLELTFLGTSSQVCTRGFPSSLAMRVRSHNDTQVWLFDAGEGALSQMQRSHLRISQLTNVFITHMHPDHVYGLPGIIMSALASRDSPQHREGGARAREARLALPRPPPLTVCGPPGIQTFLRASLGATLPSFREQDLLRIVELDVPKDAVAARRYHNVRRYWSANMRRLPFEAESEAVPYRLDGATGQLTYDVMGSAADEASLATVQAGIVAHSVPSVAYVVSENVDGFRFDKDKLAALGLPIDGRKSHHDEFQRLLKGGSIEHNGTVVTAADVARDRRPARRICICGDTSDASGVEHLVRGVDVLVHEATLRACDTDIARRRGHSSSTSAAAFARRVGAKRLILNHTSVAYDAHEVRALEAEARRVLGWDRAFVAHELSVFNVPTEGQDTGDFSFRTVLGYPRWEHAEILQNAANLSARKQVKPADGPAAAAADAGADRGGEGGDGGGDRREAVNDRAGAASPQGRVVQGAPAAKSPALPSRRPPQVERLVLSEKDLVTPLAGLATSRRSFAAV
jgi:ribonuclease Z